MVSRFAPTKQTRRSPVGTALTGPRPTPFRAFSDQGTCLLLLSRESRIAFPKAQVHVGVTPRDAASRLRVTRGFSHLPEKHIARIDRVKDIHHRAPKYDTPKDCAGESSQTNSATSCSSDVLPERFKIKDRVYSNSTKYALPVDEGEIDRLDMQHFIVRYVFRVLEDRLRYEDIMRRNFKRAY
ncbi:hypothetical protein BC938DRAFT_472666 [Jimgerdemannia flammicorona]|uniref:Uncharacterized protein n=1 Tax=Jimgerdemannia flammicorona TaxID=994334 RepID=A0A433Q5L8_9FUNG|nr:hypothetical protein BC938DRAFT_472666 [Jimgerdemannia flammicorona]